MTITDAKKQVKLTNNGQQILRNIQLDVTLDDSSTVSLTHQNSEESRKSDSAHSIAKESYFFTDDDNEIEVTLSFHHYEKEFVTRAFLNAKVKNERVHSRQKTLAPESSISIKVLDIGVTDGVMANYQHKDWWTRPYFDNVSDLPARTQSLLWKANEQYYYMLPVVDNVYRTELKGNGKGFDINLSSYTGGYDYCDTLSFVLGVGTDPVEVSEKTISSALEALGSPTLTRVKKRYPETLDYLGWCSWDAFYHNVNEAGILKKMDELKEMKLPVKWVMIDDGWLQVNEKQQLQSFQADAKKFPEGLTSIAKKLKQDYDVSKVGVWHTIAGYWGGVDPYSSIGVKMKDHLYLTNNNKLVPDPSSKGFGFWDAWHSELKKEGIDFVKVDSQSAINNFFLYHKSIGEATKQSHATLEASVGNHFDQCIINCMGMASENIFNRPISSVSRNSDDFVPGEEISFKEHALQNTYNSFYHGHFYWGDWDMFWTNHEEGVQNAVLRAVSGGPIYFSDRVGETDAEKIWPLILKNGQILRADQPGQPTLDCLFINPNKDEAPLKVWNTVNGVGIVGAFNIHLQGEKLNGSIRSSDVPSIVGERFAIYNFFSKEITYHSKEEALHIELGKEEAQLFMIIPLVDEITPLGLLKKYLSPKTILSTYMLNDKTVVHLTEGGEFGFISLSKPEKALVNGEEVAINKQSEGFYSIECSMENGEEIVVEIN